MRQLYPVPMNHNSHHNHQFAYVPVTNTLIQLGLYLTGAGKAIVGEQTTYPHQSHPELYNFSWKTGRILPEYQFVFITEGAGEFESEQTGRIDIAAGSMMILFPNCWHRYRPSQNTGWTEYWISVNGDLIFDWQQRGILSPDNPVHQLPAPLVLVNQYNEIIRLLTGQLRHTPTTVSARVLMIITQVLDHLEAHKSDARVVEGRGFTPIITAALMQIWNHSHQQLSVSLLAERVGVKRRKLERLFAEEVGHTVHQEITRCRLDRATRMLSETRVPIKSVAYASGFSSVANMSRVFRRELQTCPSEYRITTQQSATRVRRIDSTST